MWRFTRSRAGAGRCRRSPGTPAGIARRSRSTWPGRARRGSRRRAVLSRSARTLEARFGDDAHVFATVLFEELVGARVRSLLPDAGARDPRARAASGVRLLPGGRGEADGRARARAGRGAAARLAGAVRDAVGCARRTCWSARCRTRAGCAACFCGGRELPAPGRGAGRGAAPAGRHRAVVADRSDGDVRLPRHGPAAARGGGDGQALRRSGRGVPARTGRSARVSSRRRSSI